MIAKRVVLSDFYELYKGYRLYGYLTNPVEEIVNQGGWEEWLYPLAFSAITTIAISETTLGTWLYKRENEPSIPIQNEFPPEFQHFLDHLNTHLSEMVIEKAQLDNGAIDFIDQELYLQSTNAFY